MQIVITSFAIFLRILSNSLSNVFQKKLTLLRQKPSFTNFINYFILSCISIIFLFFTGIPKLGENFWIYAILGGITGALCNYFMVEALKFGEISVLGPINSYKAIIGMIFAIFLLGEFPNIFGLFGICLIIFGSYFIFGTLNFKEIFKRKDVQYRFYALIFSAIEAVFIKKVILLSSVSFSVITTCILGAVFSFLILLKDNVSKIKLPALNISIIYIITALCFGIMTFSTAFVFERINVSYALSLFQLSVILNVLLGWKLFKEKNILSKLLGSIIIVIGAVIIILNSH